MMKKQKSVFINVFIAAFGALVVGLNMGGISGAIDLIEKEFALSALFKGFVTGAIMIGCLIGALVGGGMSDRYGRKPMLVISAFMLGFAAIGCSLLSNCAMALVVYRFVGGLGVGVLSAVIPTYITEVSPAKLRGTFVSFYQLFVVVGILIAYVANFFFADMGWSWHLMLGLPLVFAVLNIVTLLALPESPRWLVQHNYIERANSAIARYGFNKEDAAVILASANEKKEKEVRFTELFNGRISWVVFLGSMLAFFQQITGINVVINYAPSILSEMGVAGGNPLLQTIVVGVANLVFTLIALWVCDKFTRKTLLMCGCVGAGLSLAYLAYGFTVSSNNVVVLIAILAFIGFFALSLSPLMFVVTSEMYPSHIRGTAMALSTGISWGCAFIVVQFYPWLESVLGVGFTFGIFSALLFAAGLFIKYFIPETKGKSLEDIQKELKL